MIVKYLWGLLTAIILTEMAGAAYTIDPDNLSIRGRLWPNAQIPYEIDPGFSSAAQSAIQKALSEYNRKTVLKFVPRQSERHYLYFGIKASGNAGSSIGMQLGKQWILLNPNQSSGDIIHELGHTIGLYHEHSRIDVESFLRFDAAAAGTRYQSCKALFLEHQVVGGILSGEFDYLSVMNYFGGCNISTRPAIVRTQATKSVEYYNGLYLKGDRKTGFKLGTNLSPGDVRAINQLYEDPPKSQDFDFDSCEDHAMDSDQCGSFKKAGSCEDYSLALVVYQYCPATCGLCKS